MKLLATLKNLNLTFGEKEVFKNAGFQIAQNDRIALLGLNGKGKSTLLNILTGEIIPDSTEPKFSFDKSNLELGLNIILIPQTIDLNVEKEFSTIENYYLNFYPKLKKIHQDIQKLCSNPDMSEKEIERLSDLYSEFDHLNGNTIQSKYLSFTKHLGLNDEHQEIKELSGGEQRKVALSIGLSTDAHIILWDEPTNHLDIETIDFFEGHLKNSNSTFVLISHDRELISKCCNKVLHIKNGDIKEFKGNYYDYLEFLITEDQEREAKLNRMQNKLRTETAWIRQGVKARRTKSKKRIENYGELSANVADLKAGKKQTVDLNISSSQRKTKTLVELKDISHGYNDTILYSDLNLLVNKGDKIAIIGSNGSGKTTLIKLILDEQLPIAGTIKKAQDLNINYFSQSRKELDPNSTIWETIGDGKDFVQIDGKELHVTSYMSNYLFNSEELKRPLYTFSGGEKNRIQLALFLKNPADIWIFDEPTNDLDLETIGILEETLSKLESTALIISHDRSFLQNICNKALIIKNQKTSYYSVIEHAIDSFLSNTEEALESENKINANETNSDKNKFKPNYKQKQKYEKIEKEIEKLENEISTLNSELNTTAPTNYSKLTELNTSITTKNQILESLFKDWQALEDLFNR